MVHASRSPQETVLELHAPEAKQPLDGQGTLDRVTESENHLAVRPARIRAGHEIQGRIRQAQALLKRTEHRRASVDRIVRGSDKRCENLRGSRNGRGPHGSLLFIQGKQGKERQRLPRKRPPPAREATGPPREVAPEEPPKKPAASPNLPRAQKPPTTPASHLRERTLRHPTEARQPKRAQESPPEAEAA